MIRFAICDDDVAITGELNQMIIALSPLYGQKFEVSVFFSGEDFCKHLNETNMAFDIVLMDIEMHGITGVEAGRRLRENVANEQTLLIFVSVHRNYYQDIIDLNVFCFIPKPIYLSEFNLKLDKAIKRVIRWRQSSSFVDYVIKKQGRSILIPYNTIMYLESNARLINLHTTDTVYTYYGKLNEEEVKLIMHTFSRIHKSYLINFTYALSITAKDITMKDNRQFNISEKYRENVKLAYARYRRERMI
ncbi:MAG: LytTR family DNA-binding domain-containing protein [Oscillospiraceae bacterium]|jgi:DNA-binding LytR/AlgR family response regulator|nr:LytTR family DNA-binding domain-containing protein [Oscillospiraceae bacterium]